VQSDTDERRHIDSVSYDEVRSLLKSSNETQQKDLIADELTEQRQAVLQTAVPTGTVLHSTCSIHTSMSSICII